MCVQFTQATELHAELIKLYEAARAEGNDARMLSFSAAATAN